MISRNTKFFSAAVAAAILIAASAFARTAHKEAAPAEQAYHQARKADAIVGPHGELLGAAADPSVRSYLQRDGLPH